MIPYLTSETMTADRTYIVLHYSEVILVFGLCIWILGLKLYRLIADIQMCTNRAPLVVLFCNERYISLSLSDNNQVMLLKFYYSTLRYEDDLLNIGPFLFNLCFMLIFVMLVLSVPCNLVITCLERTDLLAILRVVFFCHLP